jgi:hypothetical protein
MSRERINPYRLFVGSFIPNWLLRRAEVSPGAKLCYARLCQYAGDNGRAFPAQPTLAEELGVKQRQVRNLLSELKKCNLIEAERNGLGQSNDYFFLKHPWMDLDSDTEAIKCLQQDNAALDRQQKEKASKSIAALDQQDIAYK